MLDKNFQHLLQNEVSTEGLLITVPEWGWNLQLKLVVVILLSKRRKTLYIVSLYAQKVLRSQQQHRLFSIQKVWFSEVKVSICHRLMMMTMATVIIPRHFPRWIRPKIRSSMLVLSCNLIFAMSVFPNFLLVDTFSFIHSFIHWRVQNSMIPCRSQELLPFLSIMYFFLPPFSTDYSSILAHLILPSISWPTSQSSCSQIHI